MRIRTCHFVVRKKATSAYVGLPSATRKSMKPEFTTYSSGTLYKEMTTTQQKIVIIGAGYAGATVARALEKDVKLGVHVTIIERRDSFYHKIGALRATVNGQDAAERLRIPLREIIKHANIVEGEVCRIDENEQEVVLVDGTRIPYDVLICATGPAKHSSSDLPSHACDKDQIRKYFSETSAAIAAAERICIVGGEAAAVELAGEIRDKYKTKPITLVCSSPNLLSSCVVQPNAKFFKTLYKKLDDHNIKVIRGVEVVSPTPEQFEPGHKFLKGPINIKTTLADQDIEVDLVLWAATWATNNGMYPQAWLNSCGDLDVAESLLVQACKGHNVFAFGDICSISETKQATTFIKKVPVLIKNIRAILKSMKNGSRPKFAQYIESKYTTMFLPVGASDGVTQLGSWVYGGPRTVKVKGKDLFTGIIWKQFSGKRPPPDMSCR